MQNRRIFLKSIAPAAAALTIPATAEANQQDDLCRFYAEQLGAAMKARHGGDWNIDINHKTACAIIARL